MLHSARVTSQVAKSNRSGTEERCELDRYSFLMADPFEWVTVNRSSNRSTGQAMQRLREALNKWKCPTAPGLPPMQGGIAGMFAYELNAEFENVRAARHDSFPVPTMVLGIYDCVIAWDHVENSCHIISQGFPETEPNARTARARQRTRELISRLEVPQPPEPLDRAVPVASALDSSSPQHEMSGPAGLTSNFCKDSYIAAVKKAIQYIYDGDVFQINLAQQLRLKSCCDSVELFDRLCQCNPAPFSGYFDFSIDGFARTQIVSASPERLVSVRDRIVETRPIKGTRPRTGQPIVDIHAREDLLSSGKDIAENTMIVDLMRNDLARVCDDDSVVVPQLCQLEEYASVLHLVSSVEGKLRPECDLADLITAIFPGGSITGAPKVRAMEIIAELEPDARGAYCGSMGYLGFDGTADLNILIRTVTAQNGWWQIPVGGGIVSRSSPEAEYQETWTKAAGMLRAASMNNVNNENTVRNGHE